MRRRSWVNEPGSAIGGDSSPGLPSSTRAPILPARIRMTQTRLVFLRRLGSSLALWTVALWIIFSGCEPGGPFQRST